MGFELKTPRQREQSSTTAQLIQKEIAQKIVVNSLTLTNISDTIERKPFKASKF